MSRLGQAYVALSRVVSIDQLRILPRNVQLTADMFNPHVPPERAGPGLLVEPEADAWEWEGLQLTIVALEFGMTFQQFVDAGMAPPPAAAAGPSTGRGFGGGGGSNSGGGTGPRSSSQDAYLNDMGVMPKDWPDSYADCSRLIDEKKRAHADFKSSRNAKPATGRQREAMAKAGLPHVDGMTKDQASTSLKSHAESSDEPLTENQREWLQKRNVPLAEWPTTKQEGIEYIRNSINTLRRATDGQCRAVQGSEESLRTMSRQGASTLIDSYLDAKRKGSNGGSCRPGNPPRRDGREGDGDDDGAGDGRRPQPPPPGSGAYGSCIPFVYEGNLGPALS
ncbi:hypothetical protein HYH03_014078 [Edaphochlamys debaryana]|uniref:Uncharacterized protein n=1 Tax=Edaphochlamys debaryana TaxID=47281 RepID=A0A835XUQ8_9CHLO|nr:hypothetical protein HYH03_014078 [Edaphochlamys debaryana]|eukprot:KAG2487235.1 hypothetical protein HYH03_014078 [Edaphochlamys debaryana]